MRLVLAVAVTAFGMGSLWSAGVPNTFSNGGVADAAQINANFAAVAPPRVAWIKDIKPHDTLAGGTTASTDMFRELNTLEGDHDFITLSSNQFTVPAGTYNVNIRVPAYLSSENKARLESTDSSVIIPGALGYGNPQSWSVIEGSFTITEPKTFDVIQRTAGSHSSGLGLTPFGAGATPGFVETYTTVRITKVK